MATADMEARIVSSIRDVVGALEQKIDENHQQLNVEVKQLNVEVKQLKQNQQQLKQDVKQIKQDQQQLKQDVKQIKQDQQEIKQDVKQLKQDVKQLKQDVKQTKQDVKQLKQDVKQLKQDVKQTKDDVGELKQDVKQLKQDVKQTKDDVGELKSGLGSLGNTLGIAYETIARETLASEHGRAVDGVKVLNIINLATFVDAGREFLLEKPDAALVLYRELQECAPAFMATLTNIPPEVNMTDQARKRLLHAVRSFSKGWRWLKSVKLNSAGKLRSAHVHRLMDTKTGLVLMSSLVFGKLEVHELVALCEANISPVVSELEVDMHGNVEIKVQDDETLKVEMWLGEIKANLNGGAVVAGVNQLAVRAAFVCLAARMLLKKGGTAALSMNCRLVGQWVARRGPEHAGINYRKPMDKLNYGDATVSFEPLNVEGPRRETP